MKKVIGLLALMAVWSGPVASALEIEVHPLQLQAKAEVFGIQAGVDGQKLIVLTGKAAQTVAEVTGQAFDAATDVIILAGHEVEELWEGAVTVVGQAGEAVIVGAEWLRDRAIDLAIDSYRLGKATLRIAKNTIGTLGGELVKALDFAAGHTVHYVGDFGVSVFNTAKDLVFSTGRFICGLAFICR